MKRALLALLLLVSAVRARAAGHEHTHPDVAIRIDQALLESKPVLDAEKKSLDGKVKDLKIEFKDDGLHIGGKYPVPILPDISFEAVVGFVWVAPNVFELRLHKIHILFFDITGMVLETVQQHVAEALKGVCTFQPAGERSDGSLALRVTTDMKTLMPALPTLELSGITTHDKLLILKAKIP